MNTTDAGNLAETAVASLLIKKGYEVVEQNWKTVYAEIDIVARRSGVMYFVEVKYRTTKIAGDGFDYITSSKLQHMTRAAEGWVQSHNWTGPYELLAAAVFGDTPPFEIDIREVV